MTSPIAVPWGLILVGVFVSLILFGIIISQVFTYAQNCSKDPIWQKLFVATLFSLDVLSSILAMAWMYWLLIDNWGAIDAFTYGDWLLAADPMLAGITAGMVQCFFAWRIQVISKQKWLTMAVVFCAVLTVCGGIGTGIAVLWVSSYALFGNFNQIATIWLVSAAIGDIAITIGLSYHLNRRKGSFEATDQLLDRIIQLTVQNGLLTALVAIVDICLYLSTPIPYHISLSFLMPKLYSNTVLSSLNARRNMRRDLSVVVSTTGEYGTTTRAADVLKLGSVPNTPLSPTGPQIFVEVHEMSDAKPDVTEQPEWDRV
ncbi:hypothetical protein FIBSPDRAFT_777799 [Athelia psychrophila]|uniref:DUF6534 domain-containing protein n=1 Tax=Athelia psychrophila TaxID=1759441 RepID=A0A166T2M9_9AGAM|nr:hypothetical protein FIBSPDRAFT_777799 [Fibularhizoctonia sp. CBS 109695]